MTEYYINITKEEIEGYDAITVSITGEDDIIIVSSTEFQRLRDILNSMNDDIDSMILDNIQQVVDNLTTGEYVLNYSTNSTNLIKNDETLTFEMVKDSVGLFDMLKEINKNFELISIGREARISLTATNPYLLSNGTTDVVVKLKDDLGEPLTNKKVGIEQSVFIDNGTTASHNDHWYINNYGTATVQDNGTKLLNTSGDSSFVMRSIIPSNKTITQANSYSYNPPYVVEFDIVETDGTSGDNAQVQIYSDESTGNFAQAVTTGHYKIAVTSEEQKIWLDDTLIKTTNLSLPNARITLRVRQGKYLIYKNFVVYEIINGVTDENGEFALYDISDDTIFTATYGTETATTDVYLCKMVDYGVTGKSRLNYWYWNSNFGSGSVDDNGTTFTANSTSNYFTISALTTEIYPNLDIYIYDFPFTVEFDIVSYNDPNTTGAMSRVRIYDSASKNAYWNFKDYGIGHYKIVCTEGSQKLYFNGVEQSRKFTFTTTDGHWDCSFQTYGNIKVKNFRIK